MDEQNEVQEKVVDILFLKNSTSNENRTLGLCQQILAIHNDDPPPP